MPTTSHKAQLFPASPIRKLVPYAEAAKARGVKVYHLNIGQPDIATPDVALEAIHNINVKTIEYTHSAGIESYRRALAQSYSRYGRTVQYSDIIVTTGGSEAILFGMMAICEVGDEIIVAEPFYANYNSFAMEAGVKLVPVNSKIEDNFALPSIAQFEKVITPRTRAILICNPNNPTGYLYTRQEMEQLRDLVLRHDLFLLSDEVYSDFCYGPKQHFSVLELEGIDRNVILFDSVSKRYSMCGVRCGLLLCRNCEVVDAALRMGQARLCAPYVAQIAAQAALETPKSYFEQVKAEYIARRDCLVEALRKMPGVVCPMPHGAFYVLAELPVDNTDKFSQWLLEDFSYNGATVMLAPASGFYSDPAGCPQNQVRIAYVLCLSDLRVAMDILSHALEQYNTKFAK